jgi:hypothetical protein
MAGFSRKDIARSLRENGNLEAALAVLLDCKDAKPAEPIAPATEAGNAAEGHTFTLAELRSLDVEQMAKLESTPEGKATLQRSLLAARGA